ncbi:hypothetical protein D3C72_2196730 [compost metagenome]
MATVELTLDLDVLNQQERWARNLVGMLQIDEHLLERHAVDRLDQIARAVMVPIGRLRHTGDDVHGDIAMAGLATQAAKQLPTTDVRQQNIQNHRTETFVL